MARRVSNGSASYGKRREPTGTHGSPFGSTGPNGNQWEHISVACHAEGRRAREHTHLTSPARANRGSRLPGRAAKGRGWGIPQSEFVGLWSPVRGAREHTHLTSPARANRSSRLPGRAAKERGWGIPQSEFVGLWSPVRG